MGKHLNRQELIKAARRRPITQDKHLESCAECRDAVNLLRAFDVEGRLSLPDAPSPWIERAATIAEKTGLLQGVKTVLSRLTFDSWATPQMVGVRGQSALGDRRIRFETDDVILDFRAERQSDGWAFVAQVTGESSIVEEMTLQVGRKNLRADAGGLFQWTTRRPPTAITIRSSQRVIVTPELSWQRRESSRLVGNF